MDTGFELKPDIEKVMDRYEAWWDCEIIDRPLVCMSFPKEESKRVPRPKPKEYSSHRERWLDIEYRVESAAAGLHNTVHFADKLPTVWPNLGPEIFSSFYGCNMVYGGSTAWSEPILEDWSQKSVDKLQLDLDGFYFRKLTEYVDALIEAGRGKFIVGYTDMHGGGDAIAAFRDPEQLCIDMIDHPAEVEALCDRITDDFLQVYDIFYDKLSAAGMPSTSWCSAASRGKYHIPSNDFSCMISTEMFEEAFLPGIIRECQHMDRSIYHLDGPQALDKLDLILELPELDGIQWQPGVSNRPMMKWIPLMNRILESGKILTVDCTSDQVENILAEVASKGLHIIVTDAKNQAQAEEILKIAANRKLYRK